MKKSKKKSGLFSWLSRLIVVAGAVLFWTVNPVLIQSDAKSEIHVSKDLLKSHVQQITKEPYRSVKNQKRQKEIAEYIFSQWKEQGLDPRYQSFHVQGQENSNVIVRYKSKSQKRPLVVIGAHYDVCFDMPGADDNASGVAGLLELTRQFAERKPELDYDIEFVAFANEEPPYYATEWMGSYQHAKSLFENNIDVGLMISLEMIGYFSDVPNSQNFPIPMMNSIYPDRGNFISLIGNNSHWTLTRKVKAIMEATSEVPVYSMNAMERIDGVDWSDHRSYWKFDYPALMITDTSFYRNQNYHTPQDTWDKLDYVRMAEVVRGVYGVATHL